MADRTQRSIKDVNAGDEVLALDLKTGLAKPERVELQHRSTDHEFSDVTVKDRNRRATVIRTTQNHPFRKKTTKEWSKAKDLERGNERARS
ncbi:Hint domain-containing protein [Krasilnikovia sp. M28-CT-15]|uniref:Hint domain-containing protein n=1 Tax=Krasilnikovia sp. M28-CT-15 TaxID=3373540 RepID=UPI00387732B3